MYFYFFSIEFLRINFSNGIYWLFIITVTRYLMIWHFYFFFTSIISIIFFFFCNLYCTLFYINQFVSRSKKEKICRRDLRWRGTYKACSIHFRFSQFYFFLLFLFSIYFFNKFFFVIFDHQYHEILNIHWYFIILPLIHTHIYIHTNGHPEHGHADS